MKGQCAAVNQNGFLSGRREVDLIVSRCQVLITARRLKSQSAEGRGHALKILTWRNHVHVQIPHVGRGIHHPQLHLPSAGRAVVVGQKNGRQGRRGEGGLGGNKGVRLARLKHYRQVDQSRGGARRFYVNRIAAGRLLAVSGGGWIRQAGSHRGRGEQES